MTFFLVFSKYSMRKCITGNMDKRAEKTSYMNIEEYRYSSTSVYIYIHIIDFQ